GYRDPGRHGVAAERRTRLHSRCRAFSSRRGTGDHGEYADPVLELDRVPEALTYRVPEASPPGLLFVCGAEPVPGAAGLRCRAALGAAPTEIAPAAAGAGTWRKALVRRTGGARGRPGLCGREPLVGIRALCGDILGAAEVPGQRGVRVLPAVYLPGRQVVQ